LNEDAAVIGDVPVEFTREVSVKVGTDPANLTVQSMVTYQVVHALDLSAFFGVIRRGRIDVATYDH
jgi:hypothetical protein